MARKLVPQIPVAQFGVNQRHQSIECLLISGIPFRREFGHASRLRQDYGLTSAPPAWVNLTPDNSFCVMIPFLLGFHFKR
jgi:hypothetical protein